MDTLMDNILSIVGTPPIEMENFYYMFKCILLTFVILAFMDIVKGLTYRISKGGF